MPARLSVRRGWGKGGRGGEGGEGVGVQFIAQSALGDVAALFNETNFSIASTRQGSGRERQERPQFKRVVFGCRTGSGAAEGGIASVYKARSHSFCHCPAARRATVKKEKVGGQSGAHNAFRSQGPGVRIPTFLYIF